MQHRRVLVSGRGIVARLGFACALAGAMPGLAAAQDKIYAAEELTTRPKVASMARTAQLVQRSYPMKLKSAGIDGTVHIQFVIGADGKVESETIEVLVASVPALGDAAKQVAAKLEFQPGKVDEEAVRTRVMLPIVYKSR